MGDREVKQPPAGNFWKQKTDVPDHAKQEGNYWVGPPREHSVRFPGLTSVVAFQRPHCCMEQRVTHWEVLTGTVGSEALVGPHSQSRCCSQRSRTDRRARGTMKAGQAEMSSSGGIRRRVSWLRSPTSR